MQFSTTVLTAIFKPWLPKPEPDDFEEAASDETYGGTYDGMNGTDPMPDGLSDDELRMYGISPEEDARLMSAPDSADSETAAKNTEAPDEH